MGIIYGKTLGEMDTQIINDISSQCGIMFDTARLLYYRNINTVEKAKAYLNPGKHGFNNPFLLEGVKEAVERITIAKLKNEKVLIFGDYDADGVCATTVLYNALEMFGISARKFVPEREGNYGLNIDTVKQLNKQEKIHLIITVDCGISDGDKIEEIKKLGIEVIVTDHHEPPEDLPKCIRINPKIDNQPYPFKDLCGAGVAFKLGYALVGEKVNELLDLVALATIADNMNLVEENRDIVYEGLKIFNNKNSLRLPLVYLIGESNLSKQITALTLAYTIAPRVNAGGRMGDANAELSLFTEKNPNTIFDLATKIENYNILRQQECDRIYNQAKQKIIENNMQKNNIILVADDAWGTGVIGIIASKLVEEFARPVIVFAGCDGYYKGSARSIDGINIHEAINSVKDILLTFGGHSQAAGISVKKENFELLKERLNSVISQIEHQIPTGQTILVDWEVDKPISMQFARELELLEPCGVGNRRPIFSTKERAILSQRIKENSPHYAFKTQAMEMLDFNGEKNVAPLSFDIEKDIVFEVNLSTFKNKQSLKGYLKNIVIDYTLDSALPYKFNNQLDLLMQNKLYEELLFVENLSVDRQDFARIFNKLIALNGEEIYNFVDFCAKNILDEDIYQSIFTMKVFVELGIFSIKDRLLNFNQNVKNALTNSNLYSKIYLLKQ